MSKLKTVDDLVSDLNSEGARKDPIVVPDGKGQDGKRKYAIVFSDERWRFKIPRDKVMGEQIEFVWGNSGFAFKKSVLCNVD